MFYLAYKDNMKLAQLVPVLPWGHNILIMQKVKTARKREYYIASCIKLGWSRNVLLNQIKADAYTLSLKQKAHNFPKTLPGHLAEQADESRSDQLRQGPGAKAARTGETGRQGRVHP